MATASNVNELKGNPINLKQGMNILWLCNIMLPRIGKTLGQPYYSIGGWLTGMSEELAKTPGINLTVVFPQTFSKSLISGKTELYSFYGFSKDDHHLPDNGGKTIQLFRNIIRQICPDIIHIFGTENIHTNYMIHASSEEGLLDHTVINIQGLASAIADSYYAGLPEKIISDYTFRDLYKNNGLKEQKEVFVQKGINEIDAIKTVHHVIGRTDWDCEICHKYHPDINYHYCSETLRSTFYKNTWSYNDCQKHSIFLSQVNYPVKGFHKVLQAMPCILRKYPDTQILTTGPDLIHLGLKGTIKQTSYVKYLRELIKKHKLQEHITFLGTLDEQKMCKEYLKANVFICPSSIENSSNSIGEAMLLGTPVIASDVGGTRSILGNDANEQMYSFLDTKALADEVTHIFNIGKDAETISASERNRARELYDPETNNDCLIEIYHKIIKR